MPRLSYQFRTSCLPPPPASLPHALAPHPVEGHGLLGLGVRPALAPLGRPALLAPLSPRGDLVPWWSLPCPADPAYPAPLPAQQAHLLCSEHLGALGSVSLVLVKGASAPGSSQVPGPRSTGSHQCPGRVPAGVLRGGSPPPCPPRPSAPRRRGAQQTVEDSTGRRWGR